MTEKCLCYLLKRGEVVSKAKYWDSSWLSFPAFDMGMDIKNILFLGILDSIAKLEPNIIYSDESGI